MLQLRVVSTVSGSSPLARGTPGNIRQAATATRLIPARAGNTDSSGLWMVTEAAHPRSRGEHMDKETLQAAEHGSSPLARGTHLLTWGFTPYTGKIGLLWSQSLHPEYTISSHY